MKCVVFLPGIMGGANLRSFKFTTIIDLHPGVYELRSAQDVDDPERTLFIVTCPEQAIKPGHG